MRTSDRAYKSSSIWMMILAFGIPFLTSIIAGLFRMEIDSVQYKALNYIVLSLSPFAAFFSSLRMILITSFVKNLSEKDK